VESLEPKAQKSFRKNLSFTLTIPL
jgi:hypothetical protein